MVYIYINFKKGIINSKKNIFYVYNHKFRYTYSSTNKSDLKIKSHSVVS